jgi:hypothetical protein
VVISQRASGACVEQLPLERCSNACSNPGGMTFLTRGLASSPGFVTPTVVWYAEDRALANGGPIATWPDGNVHAFDLKNATDQLVVFRAGEKPMIPNGNTLRCSTEG